MQSLLNKNSHNGMNTRVMLQLDFVLLDPDVVQAIVDVDATIFCSKPHSRLVGCGATILRGLAAVRR